VKYFGVLFLSICPFICFASDSFIEGDIDYSDGKIFRHTQSALMQYEVVQEKSKYWADRLEKMLLGDYANKVLIIAPLVTGKLEFNALDMNFYFDARHETSGVKYTYNF